jgi:hypothetical protein
MAMSKPGSLNEASEPQGIGELALAELGCALASGGTIPSVAVSAATASRRFLLRGECMFIFWFSCCME